MKSKDRLINLQEFSTYEMEITENEKGFAGRIEGVVALVDKRIKKNALDPGATWMVRVIRKMDKYVIVSPLYRIRTPEENEYLLREKLAQIVKGKRPKKNKEKKNFQYKSKMEIERGVNNGKKYVGNN